jgi:hypothetical protein
MLEQHFWSLRPTPAAARDMTASRGGARHTEEARATHPASPLRRRAGALQEARAQGTLTCPEAAELAGYGVERGWGGLPVVFVKQGRADDCGGGAREGAGHAGTG